MAFTVNYLIRQRGKTAPCYTTTDRQLAYSELSERQRKGKVTDYWMDWDIKPRDMTKQEEFMFFVYKVRQAQKKYWRDGKSPVDLQASLNLENELDRWIAETREKLQAKATAGTPYLPNTKESTEAFQFFVTVEEWRKEWKKYFAAKKSGNHQESSRLYQVCRSYETRIETYCKLQLKL